jgi:hypothetical protein
MRKLLLFAVLFIPIWVLPVDMVRAATIGPDLTLPDADRLAIESSLGKGSLGPPVSAPSIDEPSQWFPAYPGTKLFQVTEGPDGGSQQLVEWTPTNGSTNGRYQFGHEEVILLRTEKDGNLIIEGVEDIQAESVTRYDPPEPFLLKGLAPGEHQQTQMAIKVFSAQDPKEVTHQGELHVTYEYLGAYHLTVPPGSFDTAITKTTFSGKVGTAKIEDIKCRFFAQKVGLVATIENRQVSALLVYQSNKSVTKVLSRSSP